MSLPDYKILETELGPMISHSRKSVYDVLLSQKEGNDFFALCVIHELRPLQVQIALDYIEAHRAELEADLVVILKMKAERRAYYEALAAQRAQIPVEMTPQRQAFYDLLEKNRKLREGNGVANHS